MLDTPLKRSDLITFFALPEGRDGCPPDPRPLSRILKDLGIPLRGGSTCWPVVWRALGLAEDQDPAHHADLTAPLMTAGQVAARLEVSPSIIYRWCKGHLPADTPPFPPVIDLSGGRKAPGAKRWRRAEVISWHERQPLPGYARPAPAFGSIRPAP